MVRSQALAGKLSPGLGAADIDGTNCRKPWPRQLDTRRLIEIEKGTFAITTIHYQSMNSGPPDFKHQDFNEGPSVFGRSGQRRVSNLLRPD
jgi:hypothetical protein